MRDATAIKKNWDEHPAVQAILIIFSGTPGGTSFIPHRSSMIIISQCPSDLCFALTNTLIASHRSHDHNGDALSIIVNHS